MKTVLVTGHDGYIGSVLCPFLAEAGYEVRGLDSQFFHECTLGEDMASVARARLDIRDIAYRDLEGVDAIIHLAALSNDPTGNLNTGWTEEINYLASVRLAEMARSAGVNRFLFSSSCIMYGASDASFVDETTPLDPKTEYARSKVKSERSISKLANNGFSPVFIRNGTVYGLSPRMRLDTVLNDLVATALITGKVIVHSDGTPWRPVVHVNDLVRSFLAYLEAPVEIIHNQAFNNGCDALNYQIIHLAEIVRAVIPGTDIKIEARPSSDQRTYRASFSKFQNAFPDFTFQWDAESGTRQLYASLCSVGFCEADHTGEKFVRLRWLKRLLRSGQLDNNLRWQDERAIFK